jgi:GNAT superfamily N-acetyltransferase
MKIEISQEPVEFLATYARIPIAYEVSRIFDVSEVGHNEFTLTERPVDPPYTKDYDAIKGEGPTDWSRRSDLSNWAFFSARAEGRHIGAAAIAFKTPRLTMLEGRDDLAALWDIRVVPDARGQGVGAALFRAAEAWAAAKRCTQLKAETQNTNVPACRFYQSQGCSIATINRSAYPDFPNEIQIIWQKNSLP